MMEEIRIRKDNISHIKIYNQVEGVYGISRFGKGIYKYLPYKKGFKFLLVDNSYPEGFYLNGEYAFTDTICWSNNFDNVFISVKKYKKRKNKWKEINGSLYTKVHIKVYCGSEMVLKKYFESLNEAKNYCTRNFYNVDLIEKPN